MQVRCNPFCETVHTHLITPVIVTLTLAQAANAQLKPDPEEVLAQARDKVLERSDRLPNFTCVQTVDRTYLKRTKPEFPVPSCDQMSAERTRKANSLKVVATDRLRLDVKESAGNEIGSWAGASHFEEGNIAQLVKGPFGTGPFGTFLADIFSIESVSWNFLGDGSMDGATLFRYRFLVPKESSHYRVQAGGNWIVTGYDGEVWIEPNSFELRRLLVRTSELPPETEACQAATTVDYTSTRLGTRDFLLPRRSELHFLMRDTTESEIATTYSGCRQFLGQAKLIFDPTVTVDEQRGEHAPISIPAGLEVSLELAEPIDSNVSAAGDLVMARVTKAVRDRRSGPVVIPSGSKVTCRVLRMEHAQDSPSHFVFALQLETVDVNGNESPLYATFKRGEGLEKDASGLGGRGHPIFLQPRGQSRLIATFFFASAGKRYVMPRGYEMKWITVSAPR